MRSARSVCSVAWTNSWFAARIPQGQPRFGHGIAARSKAMPSARATVTRRAGRSELRCPVAKMQQPEQKATDAEISAELPACFAGFMEHSSPSEKQVLLLIFRERADRRVGAVRLSFVRSTRLPGGGR